MKRYQITRRSVDEPPVLWHGGDYNPDQWLDKPEILEEDIRLMKLARVNQVSVGIFAWSELEPEEGAYRTGWLASCIDRLHAAEISVFLATPTGARPAWLSAAYPEVLRVDEYGRRRRHGGRHNHCLTSPVYRKKSAAINAVLASTFAKHPAVKLWHLSNEYSGACYCGLCQEAFRSWLQERYDNDLDKLNKAWWTAFWSHTYSDWQQIEAPSPIGETSVHAQVIDWKRFTTAQTRSFIRAEIEAIRAVDESIPFTTNLMGFFEGIDYFALAEELDVVSWDSYPFWHAPTGSADGTELTDAAIAARVGTSHDLMRSVGNGKPFLLMESTPSATNWMPVAKLKRPGMHLASSLLAIAHGSDSVQYFQWRKSRGSSEKFHGAVVDHVGSEHTRVFADVADVGQALEALAEVAGTYYPTDSAILFDWDNRWAIDEAQGPRNDGRKAYLETVERHASALAGHHVQLDVASSSSDLTRYRLIIAPMLYMVRAGIAERLEAFVSAGGTLVATYWSGIADESDLCFTGGFPGPLRELLGIWSEEIDALHPGEQNSVCLETPFRDGGPSTFAAYELCDLIHLEGARALAHYGSDFYAGRPALTVNEYGRGRAFYIASRNEFSFLSEFYGKLASEIEPLRATENALPPGVHATLRHAEEPDGSRSEYRFLINFSTESVMVPAPMEGEQVIYRSPPANTGETAAVTSERGDQAEAGTLSEQTLMPAYGVQVRKRSVGPEGGVVA
ncbi:MAG: beta-galactosidase [Spirochaetales bacterium]